MTKNNAKKPQPRTLPKDTTELLIWGIPIKLKSQFKSKCAENGSTIREQIIDLISGFVND